ncbi:FAD-dependent oxidoreductase [Aquamicrobium sp. LC103]|uniref:NAD(P)/FAD-dependent oxidoreductase n=1 Tax=Aquamicrobium sp. LC103 TaxID=1120658 RepID=UPI00069966B6|nr:FAD-dependent oxidoreductase [Aquamicrobium sp. LC103]TKT74472.1 FAD-dependent oxidoreductase [Aquamicrobium sp. LC103]
MPKGADVVGLLRRNRYDLAVVGGGTAGLTAAWHAAQRGLSVLLIEGALQPGGQIATVGQIEGMPGIALSGPEFAASLLADGRNAGIRLLMAEVSAIETAHEGFALHHGGDFVLAHNVVLATGGRSRSLGVIGETEFQGRGVAHCATCDGPLCRGRDIAVIGGGDAALQEALLLSAYARTVTVVIRGRARARRHYLERAETRANLRFEWDSTVTGIRGADGVEAISLRHADGRESELECFAIFPRIGCMPNSEIAGGMVDKTPDGYIRTGAGLETRTAGLFAIGAVRDGFPGDLVEAAAEGAAVARSVAGRARHSYSRFNGGNQQ